MYSKQTNIRRRTHLKPSQVAVLQETFMTNTLPDGSLRCHLARELGVSERTVQIWFQNRRAKARKSEANSLEPSVRRGWIDLPIPRPLFAAEFYPETAPIRKRSHSSSRPEKRSVAQQLPRAMSEGMVQGIHQEDVFTCIPASSVRIGVWARFASLIDNLKYDLTCFGDTHQLHWQVQDEGNQFRVHTDYSQIKQIRLGHVELDLGQVEIEVSGALSFSMKRSTDLDWIQCGDFTENKQASTESLHVLQGNHNQLKYSLLKLMTQVPELASVLVLLPNDFLCPDISISSSVTPEPLYFDQSQWLQKDPFSLPFYQNQWILDPLSIAEKRIK